MIFYGFLIHEAQLFSNTFWEIGSMNFKPKYFIHLQKFSLEAKRFTVKPYCFQFYPFSNHISGRANKAFSYT